jgi:hypothetical protein
MFKAIRVKLPPVVGVKHPSKYIKQARSNIGGCFTLTDTGWYKSATKQKCGHLGLNYEISSSDQSRN